MVRINVHTVADYLCIDIADNGKGIEKEELDMLNERLSCYEGDERTESIGLYNINRRIKLSYGEDYGVELSSTPGIGTRVTLTLPLRIRKN